MKKPNYKDGQSMSYPRKRVHGGSEVTLQQYKKNKMKALSGDNTNKTTRKYNSNSG